MTQMGELIRDIERRRDSRVVVLAASHLDLDLLPMLHDTLRTSARVARLDVLLWCKGGNVDAARRIAIMLNAAADRLSVIVPDRCQSAGTIVTLAAREIIAGPVAVFSPIDPALQAHQSEDASVPGAVSTEDIRRFREMAATWFGMTGEQAVTATFAAMTSAIFPPTLTAFYRATLEVDSICRELLRLHMNVDHDTAVDAIGSALMNGYHSHSFPLSGEDLAAIGLPVTRDAAVEEAAWAIAGLLRRSVGGGARDAFEDDWFDACIATRDAYNCRRTGTRLLMPRWETGVPAG